VTENFFSDANIDFATWSHIKPPRVSLKFSKFS
jgi:hypothetical protein